MTRMNTKLPLVTRLSILQQGEYEWRQYEEWKKNNPGFDEIIDPKRWTLKLRTLSLLAVTLGSLVGYDTVLRWGIALLSVPQSIITSASLCIARLLLRWYQARGLKVVAICGSYAKTSTKHIMSHVFSQSLVVVATPGNINRLLGFARLLFSVVTGHTQVFVVEMGEYDRGDIRDMVAFLSPDIVVITPITVAHLERFTSGEEIETEIFDAIRYSDADAIVHMHNKKAFERQNLDRHVEWYGEKQITEVTVSRAGTEFVLTHGEEKYSAFIQLFGEHNAVNTLPAFLVGKRLGLSAQGCIAALASVPVVPHRLEPTLLERGILLLDNGYNSNPQSAKEALKVLAQIEGAQKVVSTPGFVELGKDQEKYNTELGEHIAAVADLCIVIRSMNYDALVRGLQRGGMSDAHILSADGEEEGMNLVASKLKPMAVVLFENSVPALYLKKSS